MNNSQVPPPERFESAQLLNDPQERKRTLNDSRTEKGADKKDLVVKEACKEFLLAEPLILVGVLKDVTASSVQFSTGNFTDWLTLPTVLIEEATLLGAMKKLKAKQGKMFPLYSIVLTRPQTQSEHFFFNLIIPPFIHAVKNSNWTDTSFKLGAVYESDSSHFPAMGKLSLNRGYRKRRK